MGATYNGHIVDIAQPLERDRPVGPVLEELFVGDLVDAIDVARVAGTSPRSVIRWRAGDVSPRRETEDRLLELKAVLDLARRVFRDDVARRWLRSPVPDLDYEKPLELVAAGDWRRVVTSLLATAEGVTA